MPLRRLRRGLQRRFTKSHRKSAITFPMLDDDQELEGDELRIRPARRPLAGVLKKIAKFGPDLMAEGRGYFLIGKLLDFGLTKEEWNEYKEFLTNTPPSLPF